MSTVVYQGLQSCLESQLVEPWTLSLKLASPTPHLSQSFGLMALKSCVSDSDSKDLREKCHYEDISKKTSNPDLGGWSFIQALSNISQSPKEAIEKDLENPYVHPLVKRSSSTLSEKSLELCTESLGSETGTDIIENSIFSFSSSDSEVRNSSTREQITKPTRQLSGARKANSRNFPPPLTTISGSNSLHVRSHREDGRLIINAVQAPSTPSCFQAERSHGRLRLCFTTNYTANFDSEVPTAEENEGSSEEKGKEEFENEVNKEEEEEEEEDEEDDLYMSEEIDGNNLDVGIKMGMGKFQRPSRCKEGGHGNKEGLLNLEPFWVATS